MSPPTRERRPVEEAPFQGFASRQAASPCAQPTALDPISSAVNPVAHHYLQLRRRGSARLPALNCGDRDPWTCRGHRRPASDPDLLAAVATHLLTTTGGPGMGHDADAARLLWRRGGAAARLAEQINALGGVAA